MVRVVHLATDDIAGGAARAAYRQHQALNMSGRVRSKMLVMRKLSKDPDVVAYDCKRGLSRRFGRYFQKRWLDSVKRKSFRRRPTRHELFSDDRTEQGRGAFDQLPDCDLVNLHWLARFVPFRDVFKRFPRNGPVVWTLHDMGPFTGGCHYSWDCERYEASCGQCPQLGSVREKDLAYAVWQRKAAAMRRWGSEQLTVVATSRWIKERAERSSLFRDVDIRLIPYGIDSRAFAPGDREQARRRLGLPANGAVVAFMATRAQLPRKGYSFLRNAVESLPPRSDLTLLTVGGGRPPSPSWARHVHVERAANEEEVLRVYRAADMFVMPSIQEAYGLTGQEAMACGLPLVGFRTGMCADAVKHGENGLLVDVGDVAGLRDALKYLLDHPNERESMGAAARAYICENLTYEHNARRYSDLYVSLLSRHQGRKG